MRVEEVLAYLVSDRLQFYLLPIKLISLFFTGYFVYYTVYFATHSELIKHSSFWGALHSVSSFFSSLKKRFRLWKEKRRERKEQAELKLSILEGWEILSGLLSDIDKERIPPFYVRDIQEIEEIKNRIIDEPSFKIEKQEADRIFAKLKELLESLPEFKN